jgi:hypothetical protein
MIRLPGRTIQIQRLLMAALRPLTGERATATALVKSSGPEPVEIPANFYAYPLPESETGLSSVEDQRIIRTAEQLVATPGGTEVPVTSLLGGEWYNSLKAGTELLWTPPLIGVETHSRLTTDMTGGVSPPEVNGELYPGFVRNIHTFDELGVGADTQQRLFEAMVAAAPAIVVSWKRSSAAVLRGQRLGERPDIWFIHAISENRGGQVPRRHQAIHILDRVEELLSNLGDVDGVPFSSPPAVVQQRLDGFSNQQVLTKTVQLATHRTVQTIDRADPPPGMTPDDDIPGAPWEQTSYRLHTTDEPPKNVVRGVVDEMPGGAFSDDFSDDFDA